MTHCGSGFIHPHAWFDSIRDHVRSATRRGRGVALRSRAIWADHRRLSLLRLSPSKKPMWALDCVAEAPRHRFFCQTDWDHRNNAGHESARATTCAMQRASGKVHFLSRRWSSCVNRSSRTKMARDHRLQPDTGGCAGWSRSVSAWCRRPLFSRLRLLFLRLRSSVVVSCKNADAAIDPITTPLPD